MIDEIYDRGYQAGRAELHDGLDALFRKIGGGLAAVFTSIRRIEFSAPWDAEARRRT